MVVLLQQIKKVAAVLAAMMSLFSTEAIILRMYNHIHGLKKRSQRDQHPAGITIQDRMYYIRRVSLPPSSHL